MTAGTIPALPHTAGSEQPGEALTAARQRERDIAIGIADLDVLTDPELASLLYWEGHDEGADR